jgi:hypothetical protein
MDIQLTIVNDAVIDLQRLKYCNCFIFLDIIEPIEGQYLSPLDEKLPANYTECGTCKDENAVCISATGQRTCWCRAGYEKRGDKCGKSWIRI